jgi:para-aminobenzoate synthetase
MRDNFATTVENKQFAVLHESIPIGVDPEALFVHLFGQKSMSFWLDSRLVDPALSRFSFMGDASGPHAYSLAFHLQSQTIELRHARDDRVTTINRSIFDFLESRHKATSVDVPVGLDLPLIGGHVGYFGYELKSLTCGVASHTASTPAAAFLFADRFVAIDHRENKIHIVALYCKGDDRDRTEAAKWLDTIGSLLCTVSTPPALHENTSENVIRFKLRQDRRTYLARIQDCLDQIAAGESYEICLTNEISAELDVDALDVYRVLRRRNPAPYAAFLRFDDVAIASSSPERFLQIDAAGRVETKPIKGTARRDPDPALDRALADALKADEKTQSENLMIVDLLRNDLGRVCETGSVHVPSLMHVESYRTVHQLVSTICGTVRHDETAVGCIASCFPGGSMTGAPKVRTLEIIDRLEARARGIYSGAIGYLSLSGPVDLNIVIRTIVCEKGRVSIGCGGAIVALSNPDEEFEEILLKARAPMAAIAEAVTGNPDARFEVAGIDDGAVSLGTGLSVRLAKIDEAEFVAPSIEALLRELGGPGPQFKLEGAVDVCREIIADDRLGFIVVADDASDGIVGMALVSVVHAVRASGRYGVLQELWVKPKRRSEALGAALLTAVDGEALKRRLPMIEVSLPKAGYARSADLVSFYESRGYDPAGVRMRKRIV